MFELFRSFRGDDNSMHIFMKAACWQNGLDIYGYLGRRPEGAPQFLCSNSYPMAISPTLGFIGDSGLIKPKHASNNLFSSFPTKKALIIIVEEAFVLLI